MKSALVCVAAFYFLGITPEGDTTQSDIWVSERTDERWSPARRLGPAVNTEHSEFYPTVIADGSLYFVSNQPSELGPRNLYRAARRTDGTFERAIPVGPPIDTEHEKGDTFVARDESYLILKSNNREAMAPAISSSPTAPATAAGPSRRTWDQWSTVKTSNSARWSPRTDGGFRSPVATATHGRRRPTRRSTGWMRRSSRNFGTTEGRTTFLSSRQVISPEIVINRRMQDVQPVWQVLAARRR